MDSESIFHTLVTLLLMAALLLSFSMAGVSQFNATSFGSSQENSVCEKALQNSLSKDKPFGFKQEDNEANPSESATTVTSSCSISLQVIAVEKQNLAAPAESSFTFPPQTSGIFSQAFVYQEPDPPQTI